MNSVCSSLCWTELQCRNDRHLLRRRVFKRTAALFSNFSRKTQIIWYITQAFQALFPRLWMTVCVWDSWPISLVLISGLRVVWFNYRVNYNPTNLPTPPFLMDAGTSQKYLPAPPSRQQVRALTVCFLMFLPCLKRFELRKGRRMKDVIIPCNIASDNRVLAQLLINYSCKNHVNVWSSVYITWYILLKSIGFCFFKFSQIGVDEKHFRSFPCEKPAY